MTDERAKDQAPPPIATVQNAPPQEEVDWEILDAQEKVKQLRALFATRIFVQPLGEQLRISFGDRVSDETVWHTSIVVPLAEALQYGELLTRMASESIDRQLDYYRTLFGGPEPADG
jgi:hypothetical protein